jgi:hypothetical protein
VKTGVQGVYKLLKLLDSGFRRNDEKLRFQSFCGFINIEITPFFILFWGRAWIGRGDGGALRGSTGWESRFDSKDQWVSAKGAEGPAALGPTAEKASASWFR